MAQGTGVVDAVATAVRDAILSGALAAGEPLTEAKVSEDHGVARPSAKAAIEKLVAEGMLERVAFRSARVRTLDADSVRDVYGTRRRIESEAIRELAATRAAVPGARAADVEIAKHVGGSSVDIVDPDMRFHTAIVDAIGSDRTSRAYRSLVSEVRLCMAQVQGQRLVSVDSIHAEHERILDRIEAGDADGAVEELRGHLERAQERLVAAISAPAGALRRAGDVGR